MTQEPKRGLWAWFKRMWNRFEVEGPTGQTLTGQARFDLSDGSGPDRKPKDN